MNKHKSHDEIDKLTEGSQALKSTTSEVIGEGGKLLAEALERGKEVYARIQEKAVDCTKATDKALRDHPYQAMGIAFGIGALAGYFLVQRRASARRRVTAPNGNC